MRPTSAVAVSTVRCSASIRACSETAKSTRSSLPLPSSVSCARRTRRSVTNWARTTRRAITATAAAPIAIDEAAVELRCIRSLAEREEDRVDALVVRQVLLAGNGADEDRHRRGRRERRGRNVEAGELDLLLLGRGDDGDRLRLLVDLLAAR